MSVELKGQLIVGEDKGVSAVLYVPTTDELEQLKALRNHPAFKIYKKVLSQAEQGYFQATLPMEETNKLMKTIGMVAGIRYSQNQLDAMILLHEKKMEKEKAEAEKRAKEESKKPE